MLSVLNTYFCRQMLRASSWLIGSVASSSFLPIRALGVESPIKEQMALDTQMESLPVRERKRLLVVNHVPSLAFAIVPLLEFYINCEITPAENTREALEVLEQEQELPDAIVDTAYLHDMKPSCYELASLIKQNERTREIPYLGFTSYEECRIKLLDSGMDAIVTLPLEPEELLVQIKSLLKVEA